MCSSMSRQPYKKQNPKLVQKEFITQHTTMSMSTNGLNASILLGFWFRTCFDSSCTEET